MNSRAAVVRVLVGEYKIQESEGIINWTRFFFCFFFRSPDRKFKWSR